MGVQEFGDLAALRSAISAAWNKSASAAIDADHFNARGFNSESQPPSPRQCAGAEFLRAAEGASAISEATSRSPARRVGAPRLSLRRMVSVNSSRTKSQSRTRSGSRTSAASTWAAARRPKVPAAYHGSISISVDPARVNVLMAALGPVGQAIPWSLVALQGKWVQAHHIRRFFRALDHGRGQPRALISPFKSITCPQALRFSLSRSVRRQTARGRSRAVARRRDRRWTGRSWARR
jgi:hypothetical protein